MNDALDDERADPREHGAGEQRAQLLTLAGV
jgi:hypothetical protein